MRRRLIQEVKETDKSQGELDQPLLFFCWKNRNTEIISQQNDLDVVSLRVSACSISVYLYIIYLRMEILNLLSCHFPGIVKNNVFLGSFPNNHHFLPQHPHLAHLALQESLATHPPLAPLVEHFSRTILCQAI